MHFIDKHFQRWTLCNKLYSEVQNRTEDALTFEKTYPKCPTCEKAYYSKFR